MMLPRKRLGTFLFLALFPLLWAGTNGSPVVDVFSEGQSGYFCFRIPSLITLGGGDVLAFAEGRVGSCADDNTHAIVMKRSKDSGRTWSDLQVVVARAAPWRYVGNPAPVLMTKTGRLLLPFCVSNAGVWQTYSDDSGATWSLPLFAANATMPSSSWVATGPPGGLQLQSGRLVIPCNLLA